MIDIADGDHLLLPNGDLVLVEAEESGEYRCKVKNLLTGEVSQSQGLSVHIQGKSSWHPD